MAFINDGSNREYYFFELLGGEFNRFRLANKKEIAIVSNSELDAFETKYCKNRAYKVNKLSLLQLINIFNKHNYDSVKMYFNTDFYKDKGTDRTIASRHKRMARKELNEKLSQELQLDSSIKSEPSPLEIYSDLEK